MIVTRPGAEADNWVHQLRGHGIEALPLPLQDIVPATDAASLHRLQASAASYDACMFVSPQAARFFQAPPWIQAHGRCWAPGPGTAQALIALGVHAERIDQPPPCSAQFDSEALWAVVAPQVQSGHRLLIVRGLSPDGSTGRDWLKDQCEARGGQVDACVAYRRQAAVWDAQQVRIAERALDDGSIWLISSSEALIHLAQRFPGQDFARARALVTHPNIQLSASNMGFGEIMTTRPAITDVLAGLQAMN